ncbi:PREDICTED: ribonuclease H2 subunit B [Ipomoea nil]|uniref:ribonuclease H2 subunit B n=1 Tax=Ipomoea nil TaxID=35883 RepID=UPI000901D793|nr:PREDICTED: ribonuclease H2 subunit B [Ipomoea nil]XP_019170803.1 PREDICTED: ribonuclease H2 subunit B [Ipomoea nil]XP_019170804.1 PREDICTED: ribonuclease H2 subunit B [Ipomoea nil]
MAWWEGVDETRVLIAPDPPATGNGMGELLSLRHPKSGDKACYLLVDGTLQEVHWFKHSYGSWFLGDYVCEDGRLYTATPVDPVFVLLPVFEEARMKKKDDPGMFRQLDEIIYVSGYPGYQYLSSIAEKSMQVVCDFKEMGSTKFFRLNDEKVIRWLCFKVEELRKTLVTLDKNFAARDKKDTLTDTVSIVGEYLKEDPWLKLLCSKLRIDLRKETKALDLECFPSPEVNLYDQGKGEIDCKTTGTRRQTKKAKVETNSQNIKDMFSRATRKKR